MLKSACNSFVDGMWVAVQLHLANSAANAAAGDFALDVAQILKTIEIRPGAVAILAGLVIQAIGLGLKRKDASRAA